MRLLLPPRDEEPDLGALYGDAARPAPADRPWVLLNMVTSFDGATTVRSRSGPLGGPTDRAVFGMLRAVADVILVGAGTARAEGYRPPRTPDAAMAARRAARGQATRPRLAVVSRRAHLPSELALLDDDPPPYLVTVADAPEAALRTLDGRVERIVAGGGEVDLVAALGALRQRGARVVLCEGGPTLNAALAAADLVDEVCLTVAPLLAGGASDRMVGPVPGTTAPAAYDLVHVVASGSELLLRYVRRRA